MTHQQKFDDLVAAASSRLSDATAREAGRRQTDRDKVLARLQRGNASTNDLLRICPRFGARIHELRGFGFDIRRAYDGEGSYEYALFD